MSEKIYLYFCADSNNEDIYKILLELDNKYSTVGTIYISDSICMYGGKYPNSNEQCKQIHLTFNPIRTSHNIAKDYANDFRNKLKEKFNQYFIPYYEINYN